MSLTKSVLLGGSSLIAAGLIAILAPDTAAAQANCTSGTAVTGNNTSAVSIAGGNPNNPGIVCAFGATASTVTMAGSVTVSTVAPGGGIDLTATGSNAINWVSTAGTVTGGAQTNGPVIEAVSSTGAINVTTAGVTGSNATITRAIRAQATGAGAVTVNTTGTISATNAAAGNTIAIEALSGGGDVTVNHSVTSSNSITGRLYGVYAKTTGAGDVDITVLRTGSNQIVTSTSSLAGGAGIYAETGTGSVTIRGRGVGGSGTGVLINTGGDIHFTGSGSGNYGIDIVNVAAGKTATLNLTGTTSTTGTVAAIRAQGAGVAVVNIQGDQSAMNFDFTGMAARVDVNVKAGAAWRPTPNVSTIIPNGNFSIDIEEGAVLVAGVHTSGSGPTVTNALEPATVLTFNDPGMVLNNAGYIAVGPDQQDTSHNFGLHEAELRIVGLNEFRNSGTILLGSAGYPGQGLQIQGVKVEETDSSYDDLLVFQDGTWIGEGGKIVYDVDTNRTQTACTREAVTNNFAAADCVRIVDSEVEGVTYIDIVQTLPGDRGRLTQQIMDEGILLIDAPGSTVTAENFALDPTTRDYNPTSGSIDKGLFQYVLLFDEDASQFRLFGTLSGAAYQLPMAATAAHGLWRLSAGTWFDRQADIRGGIEPGIGGGVWLRVSGEQADRDVISVSTLGGLPYSVDSTYQSTTYAVTGGTDLISASTDTMAYVLGVMGGYAHTDVDYEVSTNTQAMDAWSGGLYASLVSGGLFVDGVISANNVILDTDARGFNLLPEGTILSSRLVNIGAQVEAGWRLPIGEGLFAEPLASVSYVRTKMDDLQIRPDDFSRPGLSVSYDDPTSLRASVGGRVGMDQDFGGVRTQFTVLGRIWNEFEGENTAVIHNVAFPADPDITVVDDFSGQFNELALGASVYSGGGIVSGFLNLGGKFGDGYQARTGSVGVRVAW